MLTYQVKNSIVKRVGVGKKEKEEASNKNMLVKLLGRGVKGMLEGAGWIPYANYINNRV